MPRDKAPQAATRASAGESDVSVKETTLKEPAASPGSLPSGLEGDGSEKHPWLLADGRLVTARLEGENLALKRAVMKARREIDELLKGRAEAEARVRVLNEENTAAAEALRRCTSSLLPDTDIKDTTPAEAGAGAASGSFDRRSGFGVKSNDLGLSGLSVRRGPLAESETKELKSLNLHSGDSAAGGTAGLVGLAGCPGGGDSGGGEVFPADKQARNKLLQTSDEISRRMEELLSRRGKTLHALLECKGAGGMAPAL